MKYKFILFISLLSSLSFFAQPNRAWGTFYGGAGDDRVLSTVTDASGNVFICGYTSSTINIATPGSFKSVKGIAQDAFLVKFNSAGVRQWGTYYGGENNDNFNSICIDGSGNIYAVGRTRSTNSISTAGSHQSTYGGNQDVFLVKFDSNGLPVWATYYGGSGTDGYDYRDRSAVAVDATGNVYVTSVTESTNNISMPGCFQPSLSANEDGFLVKFNSAGVRQWGTYYGGSGAEALNSIAIATNGNIYCTGYTTSTSSISTVGAHQASHSGGNSDGFLIKFNPSGTRIWGTYYGGTGSDYCDDVYIDNNENCYIIGSTSSTNSISTVGSYQASLASGSDAFVAKLNSNGIRQYGTYYGGAGNDEGYSISVDPAGNIYMSGRSTSLGSISSPGSHQPSLSGLSDNILVKFSSSWSRLWGTYYGGTQSEFDASSCIDALGNVYLAGYSTSTNSLSSPGSHQVNHGLGTYDGYLAKFTDCVNAPSQPGAISGATVLCANTASLYSIASLTEATIYNWYLPNGWSGTSTSNSISTVAGSSGIFTVTASNACGTSPQQTLNVTVNPLPTITVNSGSICSGNSFTFSPAGATTYTIQGGSTIVSPTLTTSYSVTGTSSLGCVSPTLVIANVTVNALPLPTITVNSGSICAGQSFTLLPGGANTYTFQGGSPIVSPSVNTTYTVIGTSTAGCKSASAAIANVTVNVLPNVSLTTGFICVGQSFTLVPSGAASYTISGGLFVVTPNVNTSYSLAGTSAAGCVSSNTAVSTITVNTTFPNVSVNSGSICFGQSFSISPSGAQMYSYLPSGPVINPTLNTSFTVVGTNTTTACSATVSGMVNVLPLPILTVQANPTTICVGESATISVSGAASYSWNTTETNPDIVVGPENTTSYIVNGTGSNGCPDQTSINLVVDLCVGIKEKISDNKLKISPNPSTGIFKIQLSEKIENAEVKIYDTLGKIVFQSNINSTTSEIDVHTLAKSVYYIILTDHLKNSYTQKLLIE